jgi:exodeoxyribonuclease V gamma subunit
MRVHRSNRIENLVDGLADLVKAPPADPFARECIVVQGRGMERWISMELARRLGVWANPDFPFPRAIIERAIAAVADAPDGAADAAPNPFEPEALMWAVAALLPEHLQRPEFAAIRRYLAGDERGLKLVQLASRIADTFDHYAVYRPAMVLRWDAGSGDDWQAVLWRALVARLGARHAAARVRLLIDALRAHRPLVGFPARVSVFGVSALPPLYTQVLAALSQVVELHLFLLSPSREYWGDIRSQREKIRALATTESGAEIEALHLDAPPLLESLGRVGRDFQQVLEAEVDYLDDERDRYVDPGTASLLATLQSDLLALRTRTAVERDPYLPRADARGRSVARPARTSLRARPDLATAGRRRHGARHRPLCAVRRGGVRQRATSRGSLSHRRPQPACSQRGDGVIYRCARRARRPAARVGRARPARARAGAGALRHRG